FPSIFILDWNCLSLRLCDVSREQNQGDLKKMLTTDPVMQAVALDAVIRKGINTVLQRGDFQGSEQAELADLLSIRSALLEPEWGKVHN
ncbi:MAG: hypothetical protein J6W81_08055, partial [Lentisphaeria bacterium]|nr:hypothetical protein [Lentisphaeria bacterium]